MPEPPHTEEGWYVLHDFRSVNWPAWRAAPQQRRDQALAEGVDYLRSHVDLEDAEEGATAVFSIIGHKADLLVLHLRPTTQQLDTAERQFEGTLLANYTDQIGSYVSVTEASGYSEKARDYFEARERGEDVGDSGIARYLDSRIRPSLPDAEHVCFYPMDKRRGPDHNWYDLPFDERAEYMQAHGDIGRQYAGKVSQIITSSVGFDDYEWGVTLFADDPVDIKDLLYEMRFDPSSSRFAEFGPFYFGRRFPPEDLDAFLAGEAVPTGRDTDERGGADGAVDTAARDEMTALGVDAEFPEGAQGLVIHSEAPTDELAGEVDGLRGNFEHYDSHVLTETLAHGDESAVVSVWTTERAADTARGFLEELPGVTAVTQGDVSPGASGHAGPSAGGDTDGRGGAPGGSASGDHPHGSHGTDDDGEDEAASIRQELADLDIYAGKPHGEDVYAMVLYSEADPEALFEQVDELRGGFDRYDTHVLTAVYEGSDTDRSAVVSLWETQSAADTAGGYLADLPEVVARAGEESGFGTMGMFYTVKPEHREEFVDKFATVGNLLDEMDGHYETDLMVNAEDENDMFIASQWASRDDAMAFFRSDAFRDTVSWGRDILADRPRHVFLA